jgi:hypothetical protein
MNHDIRHPEETNSPTGAPNFVRDANARFPRNVDGDPYNLTPVRHLRIVARERRNPVQPWNYLRMFHDEHS